MEASFEYGSAIGDTLRPCQDSEDEDGGDGMVVLYAKWCRFCGYTAFGIGATAPEALADAVAEGTKTPVVTAETEQNYEAFLLDEIARGRLAFSVMRGGELRRVLINMRRA